MEVNFSACLKHVLAMEGGFVNDPSDHGGVSPSAVPAAMLSHILDAVTRVLEPDPVREVQTLGDLVHGCWIEGQIDLHTGDLDGQAIAVVPIHILLPLVT